jgi:Shikimate kinase
MIFLTGMPGAGKTYWAHLLSAAYGLPFIDMDAYIENWQQECVSELFATYGEDWFRKCEHEALMQIINTQPHDTIVACGGGTPVFHGNMDLMNKTGCTIYLRTSLSTLRDRVSANEDRPLFHVVDIETRLHDILAARISIYEQAEYILDTENLSTANFAQIISSCTSQH